MPLITTAESKVRTLLTGYWTEVTVYDNHQTAALPLLSFSVEADSMIPLLDDGAIVTNELVDNWNIQLSIRFHAGYRNGYINHDTNLDRLDKTITLLRQNIDLGDGYRLFSISNVIVDAEHTSSGTIGFEIIINVHKVEQYAQS